MADVLLSNVIGGAGIQSRNLQNSAYAGENVITIDTALTWQSDSAGALSAGVLKNVVSITGSGWLLIAFVAANSFTSQTMRAKLTIDGVVVSDVTSSASTSGTSGVISIGYPPSASPKSISPLPVRFKSGFSYDVASSITTSLARYKVLYMLD